MFREIIPVAPEKRKTPRPPPIAVYLGVQDETKRRKAALDKLAAELGLDSRSELIQKIADGELRICKAKR